MCAASTICSLSLCVSGLGDNAFVRMVGFVNSNFFLPNVFYCSPNKNMAAPVGHVHALSQSFAGTQAQGNVSSPQSYVRPVLRAKMFAKLASLTSNTTFLLKSVILPSLSKVKPPVVTSIENIMLKISRRRHVQLHPIILPPVLISF